MTESGPCAAVESHELWEGLLFFEEEPESSPAPAERCFLSDDAPNAPDSAPDEDVQGLQTVMHELVSGDPEADKVRQRILELTSNATGQDTDLQHVGTELAASYPSRSVHLRQAVGSHQRATCLHRLRHKCLVMRCPQPLDAGDVYRTSRDDSLIIDLSFRESFSVPNPSPRYQAILDLLPDVFVAATPTFTTTVEFIAKEMGDSFRAHGMLIPPWRTAQALLSKWSPDTTIDVPLSSTSCTSAPTPTPPTTTTTTNQAPTHQTPTPTPKPPHPYPPTPQRPAARPTTHPWIPVKPTPKPTKAATPPYKPLGIKELLDIPVYSPRRTRRRPRSSTKPTAPSSSPTAPPSKLRAIFTTATPTTTATSTQPIACKPRPPRNSTPTAAVATSPSTPPIKRPFTTASARPIGHAFYV